MDEAYTLCDEIAIMDHGKIIAHGTPEELLAAHFNDVIRLLGSIGDFRHCCLHPVSHLILLDLRMDLRVSKFLITHFV